MIDSSEVEELRMENRELKLNIESQKEVIEGLISKNVELLALKK